MIYLYNHIYEMAGTGAGIPRADNSSYGDFECSELKEQVPTILMEHVFLILTETSFPTLWEPKLTYIGNLWKSL